MQDVSFSWIPFVMLLFIGLCGFCFFVLIYWFDLKFFRVVDDNADSLMTWVRNYQVLCRPVRVVNIEDKGRMF